MIRNGLPQASMIGYRQVVPDPVGFFFFNFFFFIFIFSLPDCFSVFFFSDLFYFMTFFSVSIF